MDDRTGAASDPDRDETPGERLDRQWAELLQELRVSQTGVQVLTGFLLTLPFQPRFAELGAELRLTFLVAASLATLATAFLVAPVVVHRMVFRTHRKDVLVEVAHVLAGVGLVLLALTVVAVAGLILSLIHILLIAALVTAALAVLYRFAPDREAPKLRWVSVGAVVATVLWLLASVGFSLYVSLFGNYAKTYGALAGVIVLLLWLWITSYAVLLGAEINAEAEEQTVRNTTTGPERPIGSRGAVKADSLPPQHPEDPSRLGGRADDE